MGRFTGRFAIAILCALLPFAAAGQGTDYPSHPVKFVIPYGPGGATDIIARVIAPKLQEILGQPFVVENKPGASGNIALEYVARAAPDGYTLLVGNVSTNAINETAFAHTLKIKPSRDLVGITKLVEIPHVVVATPSFPANNVNEMVAWAKKNPGKLNFASAGIASYPHLDFLRLEKVAGIQATHVPYKGGAGQMLTALISGEVQVSFINLSSAGPQIKAGKLKALAATTAERLPELPDTATMTEQGYAGIGTNAWQGLFAPAGTPKPVVDKLFAAVTKVLSDPELKERLAKQLMNVALSPSPEAFTQQVSAETKAWGEFIAENHVQVH